MAYSCFFSPLYPGSASFGIILRSHMKIAIVNDTLDEFGGAERVALTMLTMFPRAHFYTSFATPSIVRRFFTSYAGNIRTPWQILSFIATHRSLMQMISPFLWRHWDLSQYELVLSNPSILMCNMVSVTHGTHIQYIHTIPKNLFGLVPKTPLQRLIGYDKFIISQYRKAITNTPYVLTSSQHMQQTISRLFGIVPQIIPPPVNIPQSKPIRKSPSFYLCVSRLDRDKHLELAIEACTRMHLPLIIVGVTNEPSYEAYLHSIAGPTIRFLGYQSDKTIHSLYKRAYAFIFPSKQEDFGITPLEALAHGVPVIAYFGGGPRETMKEGVTGTFFRSHTAQGVMDAIKRLRRKAFNPNALYAHAQHYSEAHFKKRLMAYIQTIMPSSR